MASFTFGALGNELTEGQPDNSANKANEKRARTMKKFLAAAGVGAALTVGSLAGIGTASADTFTMCPTQHQGVVGDHTSCAFAENVQRAFYASGRSSEVIAYSPVTGERYVMSCVSGYTAHFAGGGSAVAFRCDGGDDASVVIW